MFNLKFLISTLTKIISPFLSRHFPQLVCNDHKIKKKNIDSLKTYSCFHKYQIAGTPLKEHRYFMVKTIQYKNGDNLLVNEG